MKPNCYKNVFTVGEGQDDANGPLVSDFLAAAAAGDLTQVQEFLDKQDFDIDVKDANGTTALLRAAEAGQLEVVELLVKVQNPSDRNRVTDS